MSSGFSPVNTSPMAAYARRLLVGREHKAGGFGHAVLAELADPVAHRRDDVRHPPTSLPAVSHGWGGGPVVVGVWEGHMHGEEGQHGNPLKR